MNPITQSGIHPDAESLTAFAEQSLSESEREQILLHMATCGRCREVVFLAQQVIAQDEAATAGRPSQATENARKRWSLGWRWAWVPAVAVAGLIGFAVIERSRQIAPPPQLARNIPPADVLQRAEPAPANLKSQVVPAEPKQEVRHALSSSKPVVPPRSYKDTENQLNEVGSSEQPQRTTAAVDEFVPPSDEAARTNVNDLARSRVKAPTLSGPMATAQFQQQNVPQLTQNAQTLDAQKRATPKSGIGPGADAAKGQPQTLAPLTFPIQQSEFSPIAGEGTAVTRDRLVQLGGMQRVSLPSGLGVLSFAAARGRTLALDAAGAMYLNEDGKHWQTVRTQWSGRAVLVRSRKVSQSSAVTPVSETPRFELVNDKLQTWVSADGKVWTAEPSPPK